MDISFWLGITALVLAVPMGITSNLLTPRLVSYLEKRQLIKARKTREQALQIYNRIKAFREGKRDRYPFYMLLVGSAVISAIGASTIIIIVLLMSPEFQNIMVYLFVAIILVMMSVAFLAGIYETARQLERFDDYKKEFEQRWGRLD
jgi:hypothetical protein